MGDTKIARFNGTADSPCYWVRNNTVQEGITGEAWSCGNGGISGWADYGDPTQTAEVRLNFTRCSIMAGEWGCHFRDDNGYFTVRANNSEFWGGPLWGYAISFYLTNCLIERTSIAQVHGFPGNEVSIRNCTWHGGYLGISPWNEAIPVSIKDCAFDGTTIETSSYSANIDYDNNAYISGANRIVPNGSNDQLVSTFDWQISRYGSYYLPTTSALLNAGSRTAAAAGLYHQTILANQTKAGLLGSGMVSIGRHYVAVDGTLPTSQPIDTDGDGLFDYLEDINGNGIVDSDETSYIAWDTDGDGLSDSEEPLILLDASNPSLGSLDPLNPDTGNTGIRDGDKDADHDAISNLGEIRRYGTDPNNPDTAGTGALDAEYLSLSLAGLGQPIIGTHTLSSYTVSGDTLQFTITAALSNAVYDLYFVPDLNYQSWQWRRVLSGIQCNGLGQATFSLTEPDPFAGFFVLFDAADDDGDGLSNGYEAWFYAGTSGNRKYTLIDVKDSDGDGLKDGWEVGYGLNPMKTGAPPNDPDGGGGNPDLDFYTNKQEHDLYSFGDASYDPLKIYNTTANRPVVTISTATPNPLGPTASFTITRAIGVGGNLNSSLTVSYAVGGNLAYGISKDYTLDPAPGDVPRIYSATIPAGEASVPVTVTLNTTPQSPKTLVVTITPYSVSPVSQVSDPLAWLYVVDWNRNRTTINFGAIQPPILVGAVAHTWVPQLGGGMWYQQGEVVRKIAPALSDYPQPVLVGLRGDRAENGYRFDLNTFSPNASTYNDWSGTERYSQEDVINTLKASGNVKFMWSMPVPDNFSDTPYNVILANQYYNSTGHNYPSLEAVRWYKYTDPRDNGQTAYKLYVNNVRIENGSEFRALAGQVVDLRGPPSMPLKTGNDEPRISPLGSGYRWQKPKYYAAYLQYMLAPATMTDAQLLNLSSTLNFFDGSWQPNNASESVVQSNWANLRAKRGHRDPYPLVAVILGIEPYDLAQEGLRAADVNGNRYDSGDRYGTIVEQFRREIRLRGGPLSAIPLGLNVTGKYPMSDFSRPWFKPMLEALRDFNLMPTHWDFSYLDMHHHYRAGSATDYLTRIFPAIICTETAVPFPGWQNWWAGSDWHGMDYSRFLWMFEDVRYALNHYQDTAGNFENADRWKIGCSEHGLSLSSQFTGNDMGAGVHWALWLAELMRYNASWDMSWQLAEQGFSHAQLQYRDQLLTKTPAHYVYKMAQEFYGYQLHANTYTTSLSTTGLATGLSGGGSIPLPNNLSRGFAYLSYDVVVRVFHNPADGHYHLFVINKNTSTSESMTGWGNWTLVKWTQIKHPTTTSLDAGNQVGGTFATWFTNQNIYTRDVTTNFTQGQPINIPPTSINHLELRAPIP
ncbi:MAG: hypothetical protein ACR2H1_14340 [Limisphaerales bacterium]